MRTMTIRSFATNFAVIAAVFAASAQAAELTIIEPNGGSDLPGGAWLVYGDAIVSDFAVVSATAEFLEFTYTASDTSLTSQTNTAIIFEAGSMGTIGSDFMVAHMDKGSSTVDIKIYSDPTTFPSAGAGTSYDETPGIMADLLSYTVGAKHHESTDYISLQSDPVPEPSTLALLGLGGIGMAVGAYRRRRAAAV